MIYKFALNFNAALFGGTPRTVHSPGKTGMLRISKPLAANSGGLLQYDAWSAWDNDAGVYPGGNSPVPGKTWDNRFEVWGTKDGEDYELLWRAVDEGIDPNLYATAAQAWAAIDALLPLTFIGYDTYKVQSAFDNNPGDNRGGISLIIEMSSADTGHELITQTPDLPIAEEWQWLTDITISYDGTEDRLPLKAYPTRTFSGKFSFDRVEDVRRHIALMLKNFDKEFRFPLYQYSSKVKTRIAKGAFDIPCNALRGDFRADKEALLIDGDTWEIIVPSAVFANKLVSQSPVMNNYSPRAVIMPLVKVFANSNATISRTSPDNGASSSFTFSERVPTLPVLSPLNAAAIDAFDGLPILSRVPIGVGFDGAIVSGLQAIDYTGVDDLVSPWNFEQWGYALTFKADRMSDLGDWEWWQAFALAIQGSANTFLFPTNREDFDVAVPAIGGGALVTVKGTDYSQHYWEHGAFKRIFIDSDAGRHYATVTGITAINGGNERLTFNPPLPAGAGWVSNQRVGFLLKVRNDGDKITFNHYGLHTEVGIALRTVV